MTRVLDTTLREGEQTPGVYFPEHVKLAVARELDRIGVAFIEAGHPFVSPEIHDAVRHLAGQNLTARVGAHSRSLKTDVDTALACGVQFLGVFYCVSHQRLNDVFQSSLAAAVDQIASVIAYARQQSPGLTIRFTPEDAVRSPFENVLEAATAACQAGADIISIADTTGSLIPGTDHSMFHFISRLREALDSRGVNPSIALHCHNDRGLALANALDGLRAGASIIDASVLGLGERAGIVDLASLLAVLTDVHGEMGWDLTRLPPLYQVVSVYAGVPVPIHFPVTGRNAFRHCAGVHTHAAQKNPLHYQSLDPVPFGRKMEIALDHMSGLSSVQFALEKIGCEEVDRETALEVLARVKSIGRTGRTVDETELKMVVEFIENDHSKSEILN